MAGKSVSMQNFVKFVGWQSTSQDLEGDSKIISFTAFPSILSNLNRLKDGKFGIDTSSE